MADGWGRRAAVPPNLPLGPTAPPGMTLTLIPHTCSLTVSVRITPSNESVKGQLSLWRVCELNWPWKAEHKKVVGFRDFTPTLTLPLEGEGIMERLGVTIAVLESGHDAVERGHTAGSNDGAASKLPGGAVGRRAVGG